MRKTLLLGIGVILAFGIIAIPLTSYAANDTKNVTLSVKVNDGISLALDTGLNGTKHATAMDPGEIATNAAVTNATVICNATGGYILQVRGADLSPNLIKDSDFIPAISGSIANFTLGTSAWGIKGGNLTDWHGVEGSGGAQLTIYTGTTTSATGEQTDITYGISTGTNQAPGIYTVGLQYTATSQ